MKGPFIALLFSGVLWTLIALGVVAALSGCTTKPKVHPTRPNAVYLGESGFWKRDIWAGKLSITESKKGEEWKR